MLSTCSYRIRFVLLFFIVHGLQANVEKHLRKIVGKTDICKIKNIDFIYTINLDQRPEKFAQCVEQLSAYDINTFRFSAVNGWELPLDVINDVGVKYDATMAKGIKGTSYLPDGNFQPHHEIMSVIGRTYFCHCMARSTIGIVLSHLSILKDAYDAGYNTIWVMEDDIHIIQDPHKISSVIERLDACIGPDGWDILFTDRDTKNRKGEYVACASYAKQPNFDPKHKHRFAFKKSINKEFRRVGARYGAYSMIVRRSGMKKILDYYASGIFLPIDMGYCMPDDIRLITVLNDIVSTLPQALSDNGAPGYLNNVVKEKQERGPR